jgi:hypothetical protein
VRVRIPFPHAVCLVIGTLIGVVFGDKVFPGVEAMFGDPITDIFFGSVGAVFSTIAYEMARMFASPD